MKLGASEWVEAALEALATEGLSAVAVEPLARRLKVTKGSFYWHFRDRAALLQAVLEAWESRTTEEVIASLERLPGPRERLIRLLRTALDPAADRHYLALAACSGDPLVAQALGRVSQRRLTYLAACFAQLGLADPDQRAQLAYAAYIGTKHLARELEHFPAQHLEYVEHLIRTLVPDHTLPY